ncbi:hypothetical protein SB786_04610 [Burkholderia sp. SIMBA_062]
MSNFVRVFAGAAGTSIATTAWNDRVVLHHARLAEVANPNNSAFVDSIANMQALMHSDSPQALSLFEASLNAQATMLGLNDIFWISSVILIAIIPLIWITRPNRSAASGAAAAGGH